MKVTPDNAAGRDKNLSPRSPSTRTLDQAAQHASSIIGTDARPQQGGAPALIPLVVSVADAGLLLGVGRTHLYALIGQKRLVARKLGTRTVITMASIRALVDEA
ncbi:helix-turn-helix domain-containing protein [Sphingomonas sp.]|uniref:helix-turn-helix domain-containing protein n=1 Tax=Sphingomonas sp. TaxID=28214 RepID=UPI003CC65C06